MPEAQSRSFAARGPAAAGAPADREAPFTVALDSLVLGGLGTGGPGASLVWAIARRAARVGEWLADRASPPRASSGRGGLSATRRRGR